MIKRLSLEISGCGKEEWLFDQRQKEPFFTLCIFLYLY